MTNAIQETKNYKLEVSQDKTEYIITNKEHGVIEFTTPVLPQAAKVLQDLQTQYEVFLPDNEEPEWEAVEDNVVSFPSRKDEADIVDSEPEQG